MYVCIGIHLYTSVLAICPPWPEVPASMPRSDSRNLSGKGSMNISGISGTNGIRFSLRCFHWKSKFRNCLTQTKEALGVGRSRHHDEMIAAGEIDAGLWIRKIEMSLSIKNSRAPPVRFFVEAETVAVAGKVGSRGVFLASREMEIGAQTGQILVVEEAGSRRCTTLDSTRCWDRKSVV